MKTGFVKILPFCLVLLFACCSKENGCDCVKSTGPIVTEKRSIGEFDRIEVRKNVIVTLVQDTINYVEVEAGSHLIDLVKTEVNNGILKITNDNTCNWVRSYDIEVKASVHLKKISRIDHFGSKEINCSNKLEVDVLDVYENNSADIHLNVAANRMLARQMIGGGDIYLTGSARFCYTYGGSFGYIYASDLISDSVQVDHRGTGEIHVNPASWLGVYIADRGNVYYKGSPEILSDIKGTGRLYHE
ncbi:MAG: head GIN domain-containing protein [Bacteroidota bacterium]